MTGIQVTSADDRPTREEQIAQLCGQVKTGEAVKLRLLAQLYDDSKQQYAGLRDAQWTLAIPQASPQPETVEGILEALGACLKAISDMGVDQVLRQLSGPRIVS